MTVRPGPDRNTVPLGVAVLGALVVGTGWLLFEGLSFLVGCALMHALAVAEIALLTLRPSDR